MKLFLYLCAALLAGAGLLLATGAAAQHRPRPQAWRGFNGPAYLAPLAPRPRQRTLDSLTRAARLRKSQVAAWSK